MRIHRLPAVVLAALMPFAAVAVPVTYEFTGIVNMGSGGGFPPEFEPPVPLGSEFYGSFCAEDSTLATYQDTGFLAYLNFVTHASASFVSGGSTETFSFAPLPFGSAQSGDQFLDVHRRRRSP